MFCSQDMSDFDNSSHASLSTSESCQIRIQDITLLDSEMRDFQVVQGLFHNSHLEKVNTRGTDYARE